MPLFNLLVLLYLSTFSTCYYLHVIALMFVNSKMADKIGNLGVTFLVYNTF